MKAFILAGGKGTRLQSVISDIPKPMAPVAGKPFLEYLVVQLVGWGIPDIVLSVGHKKESILAYFQDGSRWNARISYAIEELPLGTGGALREALQGMQDETVLAMNGDSFFNCSLADLMRFHAGKKALATLALRPVADASRYGRVAVNEHNLVTEFREKQQGTTGLINAGIYVINRSILPFLAQGPVSFEKEVLPNVIGYGLYGLALDGFFIDIGIPEDYYAINQHPENLMSVRR